MRFSSRMILLAATLLILAAALPAAAAGPGGIVRDGPAPDLALLYTGDVIGYIDPCG